MLTLIQNLDAAVLLWIQANLRGPLDGVVSVWTNLGEAGVLWIILCLIMLIRKPTRRAGVTALLAMGICYLFNDCLVKNLICRPRPYDTVEGLTILIAAPGSWSFPSGHACSSLAAANVWWRTLKRRWLKILLLVLAVLMALSRLYVGVHYPSDVLVGALVGTVGGQLVWLASEKLLARRAPDPADAQRQDAQHPDA